MKTLQEAVDQRMAERAEAQRLADEKAAMEQRAEEEREMWVAQEIRKALEEQYDMSLGDLSVKASERLDGLFTITIQGFECHDNLVELLQPGYFRDGAVGLQAETVQGKYKATNYGNYYFCEDLLDALIVAMGR